MKAKQHDPLRVPSNKMLVREDLVLRATVDVVGLNLRETFKNFHDLQIISFFCVVVLPIDCPAYTTAFVEIMHRIMLACIIDHRVFDELLTFRCRVSRLNLFNSQPNIVSFLLKF